MKNVILLFLSIVLVSACRDQTSLNTSLEDTCFSECSLLISSDEPGLYNEYWCDENDKTADIYISPIVGVFDYVLICTDVPYHLRALSSIDRYNGESSSSFNRWNNVTIRDNCIKLLLSPSQFSEVMQHGIEAHVIMELDPNGSYSELDNITFTEMQQIVSDYRQNLCE